MYCLVFVGLLYVFHIANAVPSKISVRPQFTQTSSAEPSSKENLPPQSWHDCIFLFVKSIGHSRNASKRGACNNPKASQGCCKGASLMTTQEKVNQDPQLRCEEYCVSVYIFLQPVCSVQPHWKALFVGLRFF